MWLACGLRLAAAMMVVAVILLWGVRQGCEKVEKVRDNEFIGHSDEASYALQAKSILRGRGIQVDYVTYFFHGYPPEITHREDHWPPFLGYAIASCFYFTGAEAWAARLPGIFIASVGLPLMTAMLTWAICRRGYAALAAGLIMMSAPQVYGQSMKVLADGATAMMVAGFCAWVLLAGRQKRSWMYIFAGVFAAGAFFAKESTILLLGLFPILAVMTHPKRFGVLADKWFYAGFAAAIVCLAPFFYANVRDTGHFFRSTQRYVTSFYGIDPTTHWDKAMYYPYWDGRDRELPKISDRWTKHPDYWQRSRQQLVIALQYVLAGGSGSGDIARDFGEWGVKVRDVLENKPPPSEAEVQAAARRARNHRTAPPPLTMKSVDQWCAPVWAITGGMGIVLVAAAVMWGVTRKIENINRWMWRKIRRSKYDKRTVSADRWVGRVLAVAIVGIVHGAFFAYFWRIESRFCFPILPLMLSLGCTFGVVLMEGPWIVLWRGVRLAAKFARARKMVRWMNRVSMVFRGWPMTATILVAIVVMLSQERLLGIEKKMLDREGSHPPTVRAESQYITTGRWLGRECPQAIVMCRNPWELLFYCGPGNKAVALPYPDDDDPRAAEKIFAIARYYHVSHMYGDVIHPCMMPYFYGRRPGLMQVENGPRDLYEIDWSTAPTATVDDVFKRN
ncbi:MAG: glycosyltransferase family 39 protein [Phycisphaerales bacterium]|nr:glycosyltransferase family 39 protein [Phycisphaerales bacterium]